MILGGDRKKMTENKTQPKEVLSAGKIAQELVKRGFLLCYDDPNFLNGTFKDNNKAIPIQDVEDILEQVSCTVYVDMGLVREIKFRIAMDVILDQI